MSACDSAAEMPAQPQTPNPTLCFNHGPPNPGITISLLEIGSLPLFCCNSFPSPKNSIRPLGRPGTAHKFSNLLKDVKDVLQNIAGFEDQTAEVRESFDDASTSKDMSELKIGVNKRNKRRFKDMLIDYDPEKEQYTKKQESILNNQSSKNTIHTYARDLCHSEGKRGSYDDVQLSPERGRCGSLHLRGEYRRLRNNMEQLSQEADHWSRQHGELSEIMKSYQECRKERRDILQTQPNDKLSCKQELEEQVKKLSHDTHSLHLIAALLQNECQILQQRVDILREFHLHETGPLHERPLQLYHVQDRRSQKSAEADRTEGSKQTVRAMEGMIPRKEKMYRNSDACLSKKARNNRFNAHIVRKTYLGKRRIITNFR